MSGSGTALHFWIPAGSHMITRDVSEGGGSWVSFSSTPTRFHISALSFVRAVVIHVRFQRASSSSSYPCITPWTTPQPSSSGMRGVSLRYGLKVSFPSLKFENMVMRRGQWRCRRAESCEGVALSELGDLAKGSIAVTWYARWILLV